MELRQTLCKALERVKQTYPDAETKSSIERMGTEKEPLLPIDEAEHVCEALAHRAQSLSQFMSQLNVIVSSVDSIRTDFEAVMVLKETGPISRTYDKIEGHINDLKVF